MRKTLMKLSSAIVLFFLFICFFSAGIGHSATENALQRKAEAGNPAAQMLLGYSYFMLGVTEEDDQHYKDAVTWYEKSASKGYPESLGMLSVLYSEGAGVTKDLYKAYYLVSLAHSYPDDLFVMLPKTMYGELSAELSSQLSREQKERADAAAEKAIAGLKKDRKKRIKWFKASLKDCVDDIGPVGVTALTMAIAGEEFYNVKQLLKGGADINRRSKDGVTALLAACLKNQDEISRFLIMEGADYTLVDDDGFTPLIAASAQGNLAIVQLLLAKGADPNFTVKEELSALHVAMMYQHFDVLSLLLAKGTKDPVMSKGLNVFMLAVEKGDTESVKIFIQYNTPVNGQYMDLTTPLMLAAGKGHAKIVRMLMENGADPAMKDKNGATAYAYAMGNEHPEIVELLTIEQ